MKKISFENGVGEREASDWMDFLTFVTSQIDQSHFVWRGQRDSSWLLESTLDRVLKRTDNSDEYVVSNHLKRFEFAIRGRRGVNPPSLRDEDYVWALGQHNGLATPLLDWTTSPFVAAFFAYESKELSSTGFRTVFGISKLAIESKCQELTMDFHAHQASGTPIEYPPIIHFVNPLSDENSRLVNQGGLFTNTPLGIDIEKWVKDNYKTESSKVVMWKICLPDVDREIALKSLNRMNINHLSLFPDLYGASMYTNLALEISHY